MPDLVIITGAVLFGGAVAALLAWRFLRMTRPARPGSPAPPRTSGPEPPDDPEDAPPLAIAAWLAGPMPLSIDDTADAVTALYGVEFSDPDDDEAAAGGNPTADDPQARGASRMASGADGMLVLLRTIRDEQGPTTGDLLTVMNEEGYGLCVLSSQSPYVEDREVVAADVSEFRRREAVLSHEAWVSVDHVGDRPETEADARLAYGRCGRLLAELLARPDAPPCLALFFPAENRLEPWNDETLAALRTGNVLSALGANEPVPVLAAGGEGYDEEMAAAIQTARDRWPEFVTAFEARRTEENAGLFGVKFELTNDEENAEFPWLIVESIEGGRVDGHLGNEPVYPGLYKLGDPISVPAAEIWDWNYPGEDGEPVGFFTNEVVDRFS